MANHTFEIERKWLIDGFPDLPCQSVSHMEQAYLAFQPVTVRIRKTEAGQSRQHILCVKSGSGLTRRETELEISPGQYAALAAHLTMPPVRKLHKTYLLPGGYVLECNLVDEGEAESFYYAEVEFESEEDALSFTPPPFLQREVTKQEGWSMAAYYRRKYSIL